MDKGAIKTLFLDIGGVLLTNGWDHVMRKEASQKFELEEDEFNSRHALIYGIHELGKISLDEYLDYAVFYHPRSFSRDEFKTYMFAQSSPKPEMINYLKELKKKYHLKLVAVSNEGRELANHRIQNCGLTDFLDFFIVSSFVHCKKPDPEIYNIALDTVQIPADHVVYIDDRKPLAEFAKGLGFHSIHHRSVETTKPILDELIMEKNYVG